MFKWIKMYIKHTVKSFTVLRCTTGVFLSGKTRRCHVLPSHQIKLEEGQDKYHTDQKNQTSRIHASIQVIQNSDDLTHLNLLKDEKLSFIFNVKEICCSLFTPYKSF